MISPPVAMLALLLAFLFGWSAWHDTSPLKVLGKLAKR